jgi:hypothetical protein
MQEGQAWLRLHLPAASSATVSSVSSAHYIDKSEEGGMATALKIETTEPPVLRGKIDIEAPKKKLSGAGNEMPGTVTIASSRPT